MLMHIIDTDDRLVRRTLTGDDKAFGKLVARYLPMVHAVAFAHAGNHADAEDIAQEAIIKAYESLHTLHDPAHFGAWVVSIGRNKAIDLGRKHQRHSAYISQASNTVSSLENDMEKRDRFALVREHVMAMEEGPREVIVLHYFAGKSVSEISTVLQISKAAAQKRLWRARESLSENLLRALGETASNAQCKEERLRRVLGAVAGTAAPWKSMLSAGTSGTTAVTVLAGLGMKEFLIAGILATIVIGSALTVGMRRQSNPAYDLDLPAETIVSTQPTVKPAEPVTTANATAPGPTPSRVLVPAGDAELIIEGRVIDHRGSPMPDVGVMAQRDIPPQPDGTTKETGDSSKTDENGHFTLRHLKPFYYDLLLLLPGSNVYLDEPRKRVDMTEGNSVQGLDFVYDATQGIRVFGRVTDRDGNAVDGAHVSTRGTVIYEATTDAAGEFSFIRMKPGLFNISASHPEHGEAFLPEVEAGDEAFEIVLRGMARIEGRVLADESGEPLTEFAVTYSEGPEALGWNLGDASRQFSDEHGEFRIENVPTGDISVIAKAPGRATAIKRHVLCDAERVARVEFRLVKGVHVEGDVVDSDGKPLSNALVFEGELPHVWKMDLQKLARTRTDNNGRFSMEDASPETTMFSAFHELHPAGGTVDVALNAASNAPLRIVILDGAKISGRVQQDGVPIPDAHVELSYTEPEHARGIAAQTDSDGRFELLNATPGVGTLRVRVTLGPGLLHSRYQWVPVTITSDGYQGFEINLPSDGGSIEGRVLYNDTAPPSIGVEADVDCGNGVRQNLSVPVESDGTYRLTALPQGVATLRLRRRLEPSSVAMWPTTEHVDIQTAATSSVVNFIYTGDNSDIDAGFWDALVAAYPDVEL